MFLEKKFKNKRINIESKKELLPEEIFLDGLVQKKEQDMGMPAKRIEVPLSKNSLFYLYLFFLILILALFAKTFWLQAFQQQEYVQLSRENWERIHLIRPLRGIIYDSHLRPLVRNLPIFDFILRKRDLPHCPVKKGEVLNEVTRILGKDKDFLKAQIEESETSEILILENIPHDILILIKTKIKDWPGFYIKENIIRDYLAGSDFSHVLGYTGRITAEKLAQVEGYSIADYIGKKGIEKFYEKLLRGIPGKIEIQKDVFGRKIRETKITSPEDGKNLVLWIDSELQNRLSESLKANLERAGAQRGAAVALDPRNGGVLAILSLPVFDNNLFSHGISLADFQKIKNNPNKPFFNRSISGEYATGSIIKPLLAVAALEEKLINSQTQIFSDGKIEIPHRYDPDIVFTFRDAQRHGHGWTDVKKAIAESVNTFFYAIGGGYEEQLGLGPELIKNWLQLFGWNKRTGIDLPGESPGFLPSPDWRKRVIGQPWFIGNTYHLSIGQGYLRATPLQIAVATVPFANQGRLLQPRLVKTILDSQNNIAKETKTQILRENFIDPENLKVAKQGMRQAVTDGTASMLDGLKVKVAAKTGTAQTGRPGYYHHWITVFAPYENPEIVLTVIAESVEGIHAVTLPVAKEVLTWYFAK